MRTSSVSGGHRTERPHNYTLVTKSGFFFAPKLMKKLYLTVTITLTVRQTQGHTQGTRFLPKITTLFMHAE